MDGYDFLGIYTIMESLKKRVARLFVNKIIPHEVKPVKYSYRPNTLETYIGQDRAKDLVRLYIKIILTTKPQHFLLTGIAGGGKTTLAGVIANHLGMKMKCFTGGSFTHDDLVDFLIENDKSAKQMILFMDEVHGLDNKVLEEMLPIIEDFKYQGMNVRHFVFIGATNLNTILMKKSKAFCDRIQAKIQLEDYKAEDIEKILRQYNTQVYQENISDNVYKILSENVRFTPRIALAFLDLYRACDSIETVLKSNRIVSEGLTDIDIKILRHLKDINKPIAAETLAVISNQEKNEYISLCEPYLLRQGFVSRTSRGRVLSPKGAAILQGVL